MGQHVHNGIIGPIRVLSILVLRDIDNISCWRLAAPPCCGFRW